MLADPYAGYAMLRELGPVVWLAAHDTFAVTRYREARTVLGSPDLFCSGQGVALNDACNQQTAGRSLIATDGDLHGHLRKILAPNIAPRAIRHLEVQIQTQADALTSRLVARRSFDAVEDLAKSLPLSSPPRRRCAPMRRWFRRERQAAESPRLYAAGSAPKGRAGSAPWLKSAM